MSPLPNWCCQRFDSSIGYDDDDDIGTVGPIVVAAVADTNCCIGAFAGVRNWSTKYRNSRTPPNDLIRRCRRRTSKRNRPADAPVGVTLLGKSPERTGKVSEIHERVESTGAKPYLQMGYPESTFDSWSRRSSDIHQLTGGQRMLVETLITERTLPCSLFEVLTVGRVAGLLVIIDKFLFFSYLFNPHNTGTNVIGRDTARWTAPRKISFIKITIKYVCWPTGQHALLINTIRQQYFCYADSKIRC